MGFYDDVPEDFDIKAYIRSVADTYRKRGVTARQFSELLTSPEGRIYLTKNDPLLFACIYLAGSLSSAQTDFKVSQARFHLEQYEWARTGLIGNKGYKTDRRAVIAPRGAGKTTLYYLILPLWALAHKHRKYIVAIAYNQDQAMAQLNNFKSQIDENQLLKTDFPGMCAPLRNSRGTIVSDTKTRYISADRTLFEAKSMGSTFRGLNFEGVRPDWLICDDIEPGDGSYSAHQAEQLLKELQGSIFFLNTNAVVSMVGTVTMDGSIMHQIKKTLTDKQPPEWVISERIQCHYYPAIIETPEGSQSFWETRYHITDMLQEAHTAKFMLEMMNDPRGNSGGYWSAEDFVYESLETATRWILMIDPAVKARKVNDQTAFCVAAYDPNNDRMEIVESYGKRVTGSEFATEVNRILSRNPRIRKIIIEGNQGGEIWLEILKDVPCEIKVHHTTKSKEFRFAEALNHYQQRPSKVVHRQRFEELEGQMIAFPKGIHDDVADAAVLAVEFFIGSGKPIPVKPGRKMTSYL